MKFSSTSSAILTISSLFILNACTTQNHPVPETENCRISTFSVTSKSSDLVYGAYDEILEMVGKQTKFASTGNVEYTFDEDGRVVKSNGFASRFAFTDTYQYLPEIFQIISSDKTETDFPRNEQGYQVRPGYVYNSEGYLIQTGNEAQMRKYTYLNGNLSTEEVFENSSPTTTNKYEYDLTKSNLPDGSTYTGKKSRNLPIKVTITGNLSGSSRVLEFSYIFDEKGQIKRRISSSVGSSGRSPYQIDDYKYTLTCQ